MVEHETYTLPPGLRISDGAGGVKDPLGGVQVLTTHVTRAQLLDLHNTPVELFPAPGSGRALAMLAAFGRYAPAVGGTVYSGTDPVVSYGNGSPFTNGVCTLQSGGVNERWLAYNTSTNADFFHPAEVDNLPLVLCSNPADPLVDGNGGLDVTIVVVVV